MSDMTTVRRLLDSRSFWILIVAFGVTTPLVVWASNPVLLVQVYVQPNDEEHARVVTKATVVKARGGEIAFDFEAVTTDARVEYALLQIRPDDSARFYDQGSALRVDDGVVQGVVRLGAGEGPLAEHGVYAFRLVSRPDGRVLVDGRILTHVSEVAGPQRWLLVGVGIFASAIQIVQALTVGFARSRNIAGFSLRGTGRRGREPTERSPSAV